MLLYRWGHFKCTTKKIAPGSTWLLRVGFGNGNITVVFAHFLSLSTLQEDNVQLREEVEGLHRKYEALKRFAAQKKIRLPAEFEQYQWEPNPAPGKVLTVQMTPGKTIDNEKKVYF